MELKLKLMLKEDAELCKSYVNVRKVAAVLKELIVRRSSYILLVIIKIAKIINAK